MRGRLPTLVPPTTLAAALALALSMPGPLVPATASASEGSQAKAVGAALAPFAGALGDVDRAVADVVGDAGDATVAACAGAADAVATQPAARRPKLVRGLTLLQFGLDTLPATIQGLATPLQATQDELQELRLRDPGLKSARAARRRALKALFALGAARESLCPVVAPWAAAGFPTARTSPEYRRVRRATTRAAATIDAAGRAFDGSADPRRAAGAAALRRAGVAPGVRRALTLDFSLPVTSAAVGADAFARRLRKAARKGAG